MLLDPHGEILKLKTRVTELERSLELLQEMHAELQDRLDSLESAGAVPE